MAQIPILKRSKTIDMDMKATVAAALERQSDLMRISVSKHGTLVFGAGIQ